MVYNLNNLIYIDRSWFVWYYIFMFNAERKGQVIDFRSRQIINTEENRGYNALENRRSTLYKIAGAATAGLILAGTAIWDINNGQNLNEEINAQAPRPTSAERIYAREVFDFSKSDPKEILTISPAGAEALDIAMREYDFQREYRKKRDDPDGMRPWFDGLTMTLGLGMLGYAALKFFDSGEGARDLEKTEESCNNSDIPLIL